MRIHRLEVEGFGPFRDLQVVDFEAVASEGIFLIGGKTGAGKSSILDAICFALYGGVPRYEDGEKRLRSDHCSLDEPTRVLLEFTSGDRRWRVERVPSYERLKRSGKGTTQSPAEARLWEQVDGEWIGRAARPVDVAHELEPILGLNLQQFLQVILLAQGRFARFLLARNDERQALLRTLFDSHRFGGYEAELERRRREAADRLALESRTMLVQLETAEKLAGGEGDPGAGGADVPARLAAVDDARIRAAGAVEHAAAAEASAQRRSAEADAALALLQAQRATQQRRDRARTALDDLLSRTEAQTALRVILRAALDAEELRAPLETARRSAAALAEAVTQEADALALWTRSGEADADPVELDRRADALVGDIATFRVALRAERALADVEARRALVAEAIARADAELTAVDARAGELPALIAARTAQAAEARARAGGLPEASARVEEAGARLAAAREAAEFATAHARAEDTAAAAGKALTHASAALDELRDRRFRGHAGELAEQLVDGEPCAVCGSLEHPVPAQRGDEPVTADQIEDAERAKDAAIAADGAASAAARTAARALADATARAAGLGIEGALAAHSGALAAQREVQDAGVRHAELEKELRSLQSELDEAGVLRTQVATRRGESAAELAGVAQEVRAAGKLIAEARGDHESVQHRIDSAERTVRLGRALAAAHRTRVTEELASAEASAALDDLVAATPFADAGEATTALRDAGERERLDAGLRAHDMEVAAHRQALMELELEALPEEAIDTTDAASVAASAQHMWRAAVATHAEARRLSAQLAEASAVAQAAHELIGGLTDEVTLIERLANSVAGRAPNTMKMNLETFVLAAELEEIVAAANRRLLEMSEGRYRLQHTDARAVRGAASGLGIEVMDGHTGQARPVQSLSGGETFLASLALALGLAEVVTAGAGGITLDTLFIDEGFGSLDPDTRNIAMRTLDELRQGGRAVGVISHVETMKDEITAAVLVEATPQGPSVIRQESSFAPIG